MFKKVSEEVSIGVLAELVENKPVTKIAVVKDTPAGVDVRLSEPSDFDDNQEISEILILHV